MEVGGLQELRRRSWESTEAEAARVGREVERAKEREAEAPSLSRKLSTASACM